MGYASPELTERWRSKQHVGPAMPTGRVTITRGVMDKTYRKFKMLDGSKPHFMTIVGGNNADPWQGFWRPTGEPIELPNVSSVTWDQKLGDKGGRAATIVLDNVIYAALAGPGGVYHAMERGYLSPSRGAKLAKRLAVVGLTQNEWYEVLDNGYRIDVYEGYGDQESHTYAGLIETTDLETHPDRITITSRSFWMAFTDQHVMGWNKAPEITGPNVTFADYGRTLGPKADKKLKPKRWVLIDDVASVAKTVFMWCGFKEWKVEKLGWSIIFPMSWTMEKFFIDILEDMLAVGNWLAYEESPSTRSESIGVPCFVHNRSTDPAPARGMLHLTDDDMLEEIKPRFDTSNLPYIIIYRGNVDSKNGRAYTSELVKRHMDVYFPPWSGAGPDIDESGRTAGIRRHEYALDLKLLSDEQCKYAAMLLAQNISLASATCQFQIAGYPGIELNTQLSLVSKATGINSRLWVAEIHSEHTFGANASWKMTVGGSLIDTVDLQEIAKDLKKLRPTIAEQKKLEHA